MVNMTTLETDSVTTRRMDPEMTALTSTVEGHFVATALDGLPDTITPGAEIAFQMSGRSDRTRSHPAGHVRRRRHALTATHSPEQPLPQTC